ncbi:DUF1073 domain-containing protein [soil metagenome]
MKRLATNSDDVIRAREALMEFFGGIDTKRPGAWIQYGYKTDLKFEDFKQAYDRGGAGHGAVHRLLDRCWQDNPRIKEPEADKETSWEEGVIKALTAINGFQKLRDFDRRNLIGEYSALIYRIADNQQLSAPLTTGTKLVDLVPVYENQIRVVEWDDVQTSERFAMPVMYEYRSRPPTRTDTQAQPEQWVKVHWTRVQILAEGAVGDMFDGVPLLRAGFNNLVDLEKIGGGSAESFLKNSARTVVFEYDPTSTPQAIPGEDGKPEVSVRQAHEDQTRRLNRNQDASIVMQGGKATTLQTTISDPTGAFNLAANLFAASVQMPMTILFGAQTGRLASDEDQKDMIARCKSRQKNDLTPMLTELVTRLQAAGVLPAGKFEIEWPDMAAPSDEQRLDNSDKMASINQKAFQGGMTGIFGIDEIRKAAGFEPQEEPVLPEEPPVADGIDPTTGLPIAAPAADPAKPALKAVKT